MSPSYCNLLSGSQAEGEAFPHNVSLTLQDLAEKCFRGEFEGSLLPLFNTILQVGVFVALHTSPVFAN